MKLKHLMLSSAMLVTCLFANAALDSLHGEREERNDKELTRLTTQEANEENTLANQQEAHQATLQELETAEEQRAVVFKSIQPLFETGYPNGAAFTNMVKRFSDLDKECSFLGKRRNKQEEDLTKQKKRTAQAIVDLSIAKMARNQSF